jgi:hypothetical protein
MCGARARFMPPTLTRTRLLWRRRGDAGAEPRLRDIDAAAAATAEQRRQPRRKRHRQRHNGMIARIADGRSGTLQDFADRMYARKQLGLGQGGSSVSRSLPPTFSLRDWCALQRAVSGPLRSRAGRLPDERSATGEMPGACRIIGRLPPSQITWVKRISLALA